MLIWTGDTDKGSTMSLGAAIIGAAGVLGAAGIGAGIAQGGNEAAQDIALQNQQAQADNLRWQKQMQQMAWSREDNAVQRRVRDLEAAGLSPVLAAGSSASSSGPIHTTAPQNTYDAQKGASNMIQGLNLTNAAMALMKMKADIAQTNAQTAYTQQQTELSKLRTTGQDLENIYRGESNPLSLDAQKLDLEYKKLTQPDRIKSLVLDNESKGQKIVNLELDQKIKEYGVKQASIDLIKSQIEKDNMALGLDAQQLDNVSKQVAIQIQQYNLGLYQKMGLPAGVPLSPLEKGALSGSGAIGEMLDKIFKQGGAKK